MAMVKAEAMVLVAVGLEAEVENFVATVAAGTVVARVAVVALCIYRRLYTCNDNSC